MEPINFVVLPIDLIKYCIYRHLSCISVNIIQKIDCILCKLS